MLAPELLKGFMVMINGIPLTGAGGMSCLFVQLCNCLGNSELTMHSFRAENICYLRSIKAMTTSIAAPVPHSLWRGTVRPETAVSIPGPSLRYRLVPSILPTLVILLLRTYNKGRERYPRCRTTPEETSRGLERNDRDRLSGPQYALLYTKYHDSRLRSFFPLASATPSFCFIRGFPHCVLFMLTVRLDDVFANLPL